MQRWYIVGSYSSLWLNSGPESCCQNLGVTIISTRAKMMAPPGKPLRGLGTKSLQGWASSLPASFHLGKLPLE